MELLRVTHGGARVTKERDVSAGACETETVMEESLTWLHISLEGVMRSKNNGKVYHCSNSGDFWKLNVKDTILMQSSLWSLAKQPHKRDTGFIFFGREVTVWTAFIWNSLPSLEGSSWDHGQLVHSPRNPKGSWKNTDVSRKFQEPL